ncbi:MAG: M18 family aminopeptidase [Lachnospiraceae bacterium]|nr:M18 family aminopeptidase [Lachnospiraceae bacterium]
MEESYLKQARECLAFIEKSVSCFHAVENMGIQLKEKGFKELREQDAWALEPGKGYFVTRNASSLIAFQIPKASSRENPFGEAAGFHITASHSDSPGFKVKPEPEILAENSYVKLNVEPYGGMIHASWLDRCLSAAGKIVFKKGDTLASKTVNIDEDLLVIPNLAIHMNHEMNKSLAYDPQVDLQPLFCGEWDKDEQETCKGILEKKIAQAAGIEEEALLGRDIFLYVREKGKLAGARKELMVSPRLDDLECVFASLKAFLMSKPERYVSVCAVFDNEEVGSHTRQGAASTFLKDTLERIGEGMGRQGSSYLRMLSDSFMISADNAHALHPCHPEKADPSNRPRLNRGIVIKYHGGQKYTTDAYSEAVIKSLCQQAKVPCQTYCNRSGTVGGSTLGNISSAQVSIPTADAGLAQLAMHSAVETAGSRDVEYLIRMLKVFYEK